MKKATILATLITALLCTVFAQAGDKAPSTLLQGTATWGDVDGDLSFPYMETGKNPSGGDLELAYRVNLYDQAILLGFHFDLGANKEKLDVNDVKLKTHLGFGLGPTCRLNYGVLHAEAGFAFGPRGYVFGYIPNELDKEANGYAMGAWGLNGDTFLRLGVGPFFVGGLFGIERPFNEPGELKSAVSYTEPTIDDIVNGGVSVDDLGVDASNIGKVERVGGRTRVNLGLMMGFWF